MDFQEVLSWQMGAGLKATHAKHWQGPGLSENGEVFTIPTTLRLMATPWKLARAGKVW